jgi:hypothetical protein
VPQPSSAGGPQLFARTTQSDVDHGTQDLTGPPECSAFVLMEVETLGVARSLGWKVHQWLSAGIAVYEALRLSQAA